MIPKEIQDWLAEHNKGDLQECDWNEIREALTKAGYGSCPLVDYVVARL